MERGAAGWAVAVLVAGGGMCCAGCVPAVFVAGAAAGAAVVHEYPNVRAMNQLEADYRKQPTRSYEEYEQYMRRKNQIQEQSLVY